ncbi:putative pectinesterase 63 [Amaranthus tricolor]|uniref:putative pectinesterase 63 n=1 Tax=Amaranthus tricolor TaxID=29722 RepID=UPI002585BDB5|nr:putative pectinesterase 63 [Amaranthus tricolor]
MEGQISVVLVTFLLINVAFIAYGQTLVPQTAAEINNWFQTAVKPVSQQTTLEPNVIEAENGEVETIEVKQDGTGKFKTISDAVKHVKVGNLKRVIIKIGPGEYREKVKVERYQSYITFLGDPKNMPTITFAGTALEYGTVDSATLIVEADYFVAANIIISNSAPRPDGKAKGAQAVAMRISGDKAAFYNCKFIGFQDTLCDDKGNHLFKDCYIEGTVDFIFGGATSLYLNSEIKVLPGDDMAVITAHARKNEQEAGGYSFVHCKVTGTGGNTHLGRAWFEAARVIFAYCDISDVIKPEGWSDNNKPEVQKTVYFGEFSNTGPGGAVDKRVPYTKKLTESEAKTFMSLEYIDAAKWLLPAPQL